MRQDQYEKMQILSERLTDVFLDEAEPDGWPGAGWKIDQLTKEQRGDRYWCKKNAVATLSLVSRIAALTTVVQLQSNAGTGAAGLVDEESTLDAEIASAEKEATKLLDQLTRRTKKAEFDKHVHGKS